MTIEEYNSIKPTEAAGESTNKVIPALLGSQRMPNFDKLILAPSAQFSLTTMYMHATEMHVTTKVPTKWLMITWIEDVQQHRLRTGNQAINITCSTGATLWLHVSTATDREWTQPSFYSV